MPFQPLPTGSRISGALPAALLLGAVAAGCVGRSVAVSPRGPVPPDLMAQLHADAGDDVRDLFWGVGGEALAPPPEATYTLVEKDEAGFSVSYDVVGPDGVEWNAKIGAEAQTEVVVSRLLWGLGYHQPPTYYLPSWRLETGSATPAIVSEARFRPRLPTWVRAADSWSWADNPFSGTPELKGLLVVLLVLNGTDLKDSNNSVYEAHGSGAASRRYVVHDLGAALGATGRMFPSRNWIEGFEREPFLTAVSGGAVAFGYRGRHRHLLSMIGPDDLRWAADRLQRLTDAQWRDAFRAAHYPAATADRYISRIQEKIADARALRVDRRAAGPTAGD